MKLLEGSFEERLRESISFAWIIFMNKVGAGKLHINKEASMQLHYSMILQQVVPLICFNKNERASIELETSIKIGDKTREIDLVLTGYEKSKEYKIAVEMKCYKEITSSGGKRGATDIFMKDVYEDLYLLENYCNHSKFQRGVSLVMNDLERLVHPKQKKAKCWDYDISFDTKISNLNLNTPIGGKEINFSLEKTYFFKWQKNGHYWFLENEGL